MTPVAGVDCWCPDVGWAGEADPGGYVVSQRAWTLDGTVWCRRGEGPITAVAVRRLVRRGHPRVFHASIGAVHEHVGGGRERLLEAAEAGLAGRMPPTCELQVVQLRDDRRGVALLVLENC